MQIRFGAMYSLRGTTAEIEEALAEIKTQNTLLDVPTEAFANGIISHFRPKTANTPEERADFLVYDIVTGTEDVAEFRTIQPEYQGWIERRDAYRDSYHPPSMGTAEDGAYQEAFRQGIPPVPASCESFFRRFQEQTTTPDLPHEALSVALNAMDAMFDTVKGVFDRS